MKRFLFFIMMLLMFSDDPVVAQDGKVFASVRRGSFKEVEKLLKDSPDLVKLRNSEGETVLFDAARYNQNEIVKLLLKKGADPMAPNPNGYTPFHHAVFGRNKEILKLFINSGADLDYIQYYVGGVDGSVRIGTPLITNIVRYCDVEIFKLFLEKGADIHLCEEEGRSSLSAIYDNDLDKLKLFLEYGADINVRFAENRNVLMNALTLPCYNLAEEKMTRNTEFIKFLIENDADISARDDLDWTPLHYTIWYNNLPALKLLLKAVADPKIRSPILSSPLKLAKKMKRTEMTKLLKNAAKRSVN